MSLTALPFDAPLSAYQQQADALLARAVAIDREDALLAVARWYEFADWLRLADYVDAVSERRRSRSTRRSPPIISTS